MPYAIQTTARADADIDAAVGWISRQSPAAAARWHAMAHEAMRSLATNAGRCPLADEAGALGLDLRELLIGRRRGVYRVLFTVSGQTVTIHRVRHSAQDQLRPGDV